MNFIDAECVIDGDKVTLKFGDFEVVLPEEKAKKLIAGGYNEKTVIMGIRPEDISDAAEALERGAVVESDVTGYELLGKEAMLYFSIAGTHMSAVVPADTQARYGDHVKLAFDPIKIHVFDKETELTITN
jgi:multiple sugar transport system ATP-binding protein